jgi:hypothetical protein
MRRIAFAALLAFAIAVAAVTPAFADSGGGPGKDPPGKINVWCALDQGTKVDINGNVIVPDGSKGDVDLWLLGSKNGKTWQFAWQGKIVHVVKGQTTYGFSFDGKLDANHFMDFRVVGGGTESRVINRDECGFRVPEAPASALLLLGAFPAVGLIAIKASGVRLPLPHRQRIA